MKFSSSLSVLKSQIIDNGIEINLSMTKKQKYPYAVIAWDVDADLLVHRVNCLNLEQAETYYKKILKEY